MRSLFVLLITCAAISCSAQDFTRIADSIRRIRSIPAMAYAVFRSDKILVTGVSGVRKYRTHDSARITDRFHIGTNTFGFTSWIAGKLVESGKLKWTTTFASLYPQYKSRLLPEFQDVDLKGLLSNTAGIPAYTAVKDYQYVPFFESDIRAQRREFANWLLQRPGIGSQGKTKMIESIAGYTIAASMLEKVSGSSWEKMIDEYVNKPLGIAVKFGWPNKISDQQPAGHWSLYGPLTPEPADTWLKPYPPAAAAADINISIEDYARFLQEHLKGLRGEKAYLSKRTLDLIHFGLLDYSFGWNNAVLGKDRFSFHTGSFLIFTSYVELIPERNLGVIVLCNNGDNAAKSGAVHMARLLRDYYLFK